MTSPRLSRLADQHPRRHSFGEAVYRRQGFREGTIAFSRYPEVDGAFCRANLGYLRGVVERLSGGPAAVFERSCQCRRDESCQFWISWAP